MFLKNLISLFAGLTAVLLLAIGCSSFNPPTASQDSSDPHGGLWNPQPGDEIIPGHEVPLVSEDYWGSGPEINPLRNLVTRLIGILGGTLNLGHHSCIFPAGAVNGLTLFSMSYASQTGIAVDLNPSPYQFNVPVTIRLSYRGTQYEDWNTPPPLQVFYMAPDGSLTPLPSTVNHTNKTVSAQVDHFSRYIVG